MKEWRCTGCGAAINPMSGTLGIKCEFCGSIFTFDADSESPINNNVDSAVIDAQVLALFSEADKLRNKNKNVEEIQTLTKALELDPNSALGWGKLGRAYRVVGLVDKAIDCYQNAIAIDPDDGAFYCNLGAAYISKGDNQLAVSYYEKGLPMMTPSTKNEYPICLGNYALALGRCGRKSEAIKHIKEAERLGYANAKIIKKELGIGGLFGGLH